jgi:cytochrome b561
MEDKVANTTRWILYSLLFISALAGVLFYTGALGPQEGGAGVGSSNLIYIGNIFVYVALIVLIVTPIYTMINNPQNVGKMLISIGVLIVVLAVSYGLASNSYTPFQLESFGNGMTAEISRLVGAGLYAAYITLGLAAVAILYSAIIKIIK